MSLSLLPKSPGSQHHHHETHLLYPTLPTRQFQNNNPSVPTNNTMAENRQPFLKLRVKDSENKSGKELNRKGLCWPYVTIWRFALLLRILVLYCWSGFHSSMWEAPEIIALALWEFTHVYKVEETWGKSSVGSWNDCFIGNSNVLINSRLQFPSIMNEDKERKVKFARGDLGQVIALNHFLIY